MEWISRLRTITGFIFWPQACAACGEVALNPQWAPLCEGCRGSLQPIRVPVCLCCGVPLEGDILGTDRPCSRCRRSPFDLGAARAWGSYEGLLRQLLRAFKFGGQARLSYPLGELLYRAHRRYFEPTAHDLIVPVPLHRSRLRERGFDQSALLARRLRKRSGLPVQNALVRVRKTCPQSGLDSRSRAGNVRGAFRLRSSVALEGKRILLVDDVLTTGTTAQEASSLLWTGKPRSVDLLTVARVARRATFGR